MGYAAVNPFEKKLVIPELERCFDTMGFSAIKLHSQLMDCAADTPLYDPVYAFANERRITIMAHNFPEASVMERICEKYPDAFFVQAHYGIAWDGNSEPPFFKMAKTIPNFYIDNAGSHSYAGVIEKTAAAVGPENLIFGTDFTFFDPRNQVGNVVFSNIPETHKRMILRDNFKRLMDMRQK